MTLTPQIVLDAINGHIKDITATFDIGAVAVSITDDKTLSISIGLKPK